VDLKTRFTLFFSLLVTAFLGIFSTATYWEVRNRTLSNAEQSLMNFLAHEWNHIDSPDHQSDAKGNGPHYKGLYLRIQKQGSVVYDTFPRGEDDRTPGVDLTKMRIYRSLVQVHEGVPYEIAGYIDLSSEMDYLNFLKSVLVGGVAISLILLVILSLLAARFLLKPFCTLASQTSQISAEKLSFRFLIPKQLDEFGVLTNNFNSLLERLEKSFHQVQRFTSSASHELRTPLSVIIGQGEIALRRERDAKEYRTAIEKMLHRAKDLREIINRLLYLSESGCLPVSDNDSIRILDFISELSLNLSLAYQAQEKEIIVDDQSPNIEFISNRPILQSVLTNLIENGLKYSTHKTHVSWKMSSSNLTLQIDDDGPGIPKEKSNLVFEPFMKLQSDPQGSNSVKSYGLGLSIVKACVDSMKGTIELGNATLGGLSVKVSIPVGASNQH